MVAGPGSERMSMLFLTRVDLRRALPFGAGGQGSVARIEVNRSPDARSSDFAEPAAGGRSELLPAVAEAEKSIDLGQRRSVEVLEGQRPCGQPVLERVIDAYGVARAHTDLQVRS